MKTTAFTLLVAGLPMLGFAQDINIEAESGVIHPPFVSTNGYIFQPDATDITKGGLAEYEFDIAQAGPFMVKGVLSSAELATNAFAVSIDAEPSNANSVWIIQPTTGFETKVVTSAPGTNMLFQLTVGKHRLLVRGLAANVKVDRWEISEAKRPRPPINVRIAGAP